MPLRSNVTCPVCGKDCGRRGMRWECASCGSNGGFLGTNRKPGRMFIKEAPPSPEAALARERLARY